MTASAMQRFGGRFVILVLAAASLAVLVTSFAYRLEHPHMAEHVQPRAQMPAGMGQGGGPNMAHIQELMGSLQNDPNNREVLLELGNDFLRMQAWDRAGTFFEKARALDPKDPAALSGLAMVRFQRKEYGSAADLFRKMVELDASNYGARYNLGVLQKFFLDQEAEGNAVLKAIADDPTVPANLQDSARQQLERNIGE